MIIVHNVICELTRGSTKQIVNIPINYVPETTLIFGKEFVVKRTLSVLAALAKEDEQIKLKVSLPDMTLVNTTGINVPNTATVHCDNENIEVKTVAIGGISIYPYTKEIANWYVANNYDEYESVILSALETNRYSMVDINNVEIDHCKKEIHNGRTLFKDLKRVTQEETEFANRNQKANNSEKSEQTETPNW